MMNDSGGWMEESSDVGADEQRRRAKHARSRVRFCKKRQQLRTCWSIARAGQGGSDESWLILGGGGGVARGW